MVRGPSGNYQVLLCGRERGREVGEGVKVEREGVRGILPCNVALL